MRGTSFQIIEGDCLAVMRTMAANSVDSIVTDPPYGLWFKEKAWDKSVPTVEVWAEALRVAKPGAYLMAFGGTRTYHRLTCAIEDAGWEIRDCLMWVYGKSWPKNHDISKAIDREKHDQDEVLKVTTFVRDAKSKTNVTNQQIDDVFGVTGMAAHWVASTGQATVPSVERWERLKVLLGFGPEMDETVKWLNDRKGKPDETWDERVVLGEAESTIDGTIAGEAGERKEEFLAQHKKASYKITAPKTEAAKKWEGWGTALRPLWEPIVMARKPVEGATQQNVVEYGTGAINIGRAIESDGRWPTNMLRDESAEALSLPVSRYCYCAKASRDERTNGGEVDNRHATVKPVAVMQWLIQLVTRPGGLVVDPFCGSGSTGVACAACGCGFVGIEIEPASAATARARLNAATKQGNLF